MWKCATFENYGDIKNVNNLGADLDEIIISNVFDESNNEGDIIIKWLTKLKKLEISWFDNCFDNNIVISDNPELEEITIKSGYAKTITITNNGNLKQIDFSLFWGYFEQSYVYTVEKQNLLIENNNKNLHIKLSECEKAYYFWDESKYSFTIIENTPEQFHEFIEWFEWNWYESIMLPVMESFVYNSKIDKINLLYLYDLWSWFAGSWSFKELMDMSSHCDYQKTYDFLLKVEKLVDEWKYNSFTPELLDEYPFKHRHKEKGVPEIMLKHSGYIPSNVNEDTCNKIEDDFLCDTTHNSDEWYYVDDNKVYFDGELIEWCDWASFEIISEEESYAKDKDNVFFECGMLKWAKLDTFRLIWDWMFSDGVRLYYFGDDITEDDPELLEEIKENFFS